MPNSQTMNSWWMRNRTIPGKGKRDGIIKIPAQDATKPSPYMLELAAGGRDYLNRLSHGYSKKIQAAEGRLNHAAENYRNHVEKYQIESPAYNTKKRDLGRGVTKHLSRRWYIIFILVIVLGEFALNAQAFDVFGKEPWLTYVMALTVAIGLPVSAHFIGLMSRQLPRPLLKTAIVLAGSVALLLFCLIGINSARIYFMEMWHPDQVAGLKALQKPFLYINLFVFGCAFLMSFFAHDADSELDNLHVRVTRLEEQMDADDAAIHRAYVQLDDLGGGRKSAIDAGKDLIAELIYIYQGANERHRPAGTRPTCFDEDPRELLELDPFTDLQVAVTEDEVNNIRVARRVAQSNGVHSKATVPPVAVPVSRVAAPAPPVATPAPPVADQGE